MDIDLYTELTGVEIAESKRTRFQALIKRTQIKLEALLGWSFTPQVLYTELGRTETDCLCPKIPETLLPPDEVKGIIKVFPVNQKDKYFHVDPFKNVYAVKLVGVEENREFITFKTFERLNPHFNNQGFAKYIERCRDCFCDCRCQDCVQLAVDADWLDISEDDFPKDLLYLLCDMIDFYGDETHDIKSESVDGHSWSKGDIVAPEADKNALALIAKYAGPFGSIERIRTI